MATKFMRRGSCTTARAHATSRTAGAPPRGPVASHLQRLQATAGNRSVQRLLSSVVLMQPDKGADKPPKKGDVKKEEAKKVEWARAPSGQPRLLDGTHASFDVFFDHVVPDVPKGKKQMWQVVENANEVLTEDCKVKTDRSFIIDIVDIGDRTTIKDQWAWDAAGDPCFARRVSNATVGFDDGKSGYSQQTNVKASKSLAKDTLRKMKSPKGTYSGTYTFVNKELCKKCAKQLDEIQKKRGAPEGETLKITGVGDWTSSE